MRLGIALAMLLMFAIPASAEARYAARTLTVGSTAATSSNFRST